MNSVWLSIDTATDVASLAITLRDGDVVERAIDIGPRRHAARLLAEVDTLLDETGRCLRDVSDVVIADGPGSFTGIRVAAAMVAGIAFGRDARVYAVPSLHGCARHIAAKLNTREPVAAVYDALRGEVYVAILAGEVVRTAPRVMPVAALSSAGAVVAAGGAGAVQYADVIRGWTGRDPVTAAGEGASATELLTLARNNPAAYRIPTFAEWSPAYGRPAEAQVRWEALHGKPLPHSTRDGP